MPPSGLGPAPPQHTSTEWDSLPSDIVCLILREALNPLASGVCQPMMRHFVGAGGVTLTLRKAHRRKPRQKIMRDALKHAHDITLVAMCSMRTLFKDDRFCGVKAFKLAQVCVDAKGAAQCRCRCRCRF